MYSLLFLNSTLLSMRDWSFVLYRRLIGSLILILRYKSFRQRSSSICRVNRCRMLSIEGSSLHHVRTRRVMSCLLYKLRASKLSIKRTNLTAFWGFYFWIKVRLRLYIFMRPFSSMGAMRIIFNFTCKPSFLSIIVRWFYIMRWQYQLVSSLM